MNCPFCKADTFGKTNEEEIEEIMTRVEVNDAYSIYVLGSHYYHGKFGLLQDGREQGNYGNRQQHWGPARRILNWVLSMTKGAI